MANTKIESISQMQGFGNDFILARGYRHAIIEYHRSSGIQKSKGSGFAMQTIGVLQHVMDFSAVTQGNGSPSSLVFSRSLGVNSQFAGSYVLCSSQGGDIIQSQGGLANSGAEYVHTIASNSHAYFSNLIVDPKSRILYAQDRYLGMMDPLSGTPNYNTGTIQVTNGSTAVVGTGTTFLVGMVGKVIQIPGDKKFYLISAFTDATHITLSAIYTGTTGSGKLYVINTQWNDSFKDFGSTIAIVGGFTPACAMDIYEDTVLFGRGNNLCTLNVTTDSITTDSLPALSFPVGYNIGHVSSNSNGILLGINTTLGKGLVALWDNYSTRSIAPWIWFNDSIISVTKIEGGWIVITTTGIYTTDGYTSKLIKSNFLEATLGAFLYTYPKNSVVLNNYLYFGGTAIGSSKRRAVIYKYDFSTNLVEAIPRANLNQAQPQFLQLEYAPSTNLLYVMVNNVTGNGVDVYNPKIAPLCSNYISSVVGQGDNNKVADRFRLKIRKANSYGSITFPDTFSFTIAVKISGNKRQMYGYQQVKTTSVSKSIITVDNSAGTSTTPQLGDEVEFMGDGVSDNNAGYCRNIIGITGGGSSSEVWTLDSDLPSLPQANQNITLTPFQLVKRYTITVAANAPIEPLLFSVNNSPKGRNFFMKIDIEDNTSGIPLEIDDIDFHYDDLGQN